jgi:hypothetical protein
MAFGADRKFKRHFAPAFTSAPCADNRRKNLRIVTNRANPHNTRDNAEVIGIRGHGQGHHVQLQIASGLASRTSREQT